MDKMRLLLEIDLEVTDRAAMAAFTMDFAADERGNVTGMAEPSDVTMAFLMSFGDYLRSASLPGFRASIATNLPRPMTDGGNWAAFRLPAWPGPGRSFGQPEVVRDPAVVADWPNQADT